MRNLIFGGIGVVWGAAILFFHFTKETPPAKKGNAANEAYAAGDSMGVVFGGLLLVVGLYYLVKGLKGKPKDVAALPE